MPLHVTLKRLRSKWDLKWLRISMSYHRFPNMRELFQSDLVQKVMSGIGSRDFCDRPCNCLGPRCAFDGKCRAKMVVYKATIKATGRFYIGATQQTFKDRFRGHFQDVRNLVLRRVGLDTFARELALPWVDTGVVPTVGMLRDACSYAIVWQGNPFSCVKSFGNLGCKLCSKERSALLRARWTSPDLLINKGWELYGACRHKARFHRLFRSALDTDDPPAGERVRTSAVD